MKKYMYLRVPRAQMTHLNVLFEPVLVVAA
jgi:hypothetical protein